MYCSTQRFMGLVACMFLAGARAEAHGPEKLDEPPISVEGIEEIRVYPERGSPVITMAME